MIKKDNNKSEQHKLSVDKLIKKEHLNVFLDNLPFLVMVVHRDRTVLAANRVAREIGAKLGGYCWRDFGCSDFASEEDKKYADEQNRIPSNGTCSYFCF